MNRALLPLRPLPGTSGEHTTGSIASDWLFRLNSARRAPNAAQALADLFCPDPWWRDHLALTWDLRTFHGLNHILEFLGRTLALRRAGPFTLEPESAKMIQMGAQISFVYASFTFETMHCKCWGGVKLVSGPDGHWRAWNVYTRVEELKGCESNIRRLDVQDKDVKKDFDVVVLGGGQCGLQLTAALRTLGVSVLVIEQNSRLGDHWRRHYDCLRLHLPKQHSEFRYRQFPASMPLYPPKDHIAGFLEDYAQSCNLNVWCSSRIQCATFEERTKSWSLEILNQSGATRRVYAGQLVLATGILGTSSNMPDIPNKTLYQGSVIHSLQFKNGAAWQGRRAIVVGAGTSAHDIAEDLYRHGAHVLMVQRGPTAVVSQELATACFAHHYMEGVSPDVVDRALESTPVLLNPELARAAAAYMKQIDAPLRSGLERTGFLFAPGDEAEMLYERFGGYYIETGCSKLLIEGKIRLKSGLSVTSFTSRGMTFADGSEIPADVIIFATGFDTGNMHRLAVDLIGPQVGLKLREPWGLNEEGEVNAVWRDSGHPYLWYHGGDLKGARYYSKLLALQILARKLGILERSEV